MNDCAHEWLEGEIECAPYLKAMNGESELHPCVYCEKCMTPYDLAHEPDPREM